MADPWLDNSAGYSGEDLDPYEPLAPQKMVLAAMRGKKQPALTSMPTTGMETPKPATSGAYGGGTPMPAPTEPPADAGAAPKALPMTMESIMQQISERASKRPDATPYVEQARRRQQGSSDDLIAGMALQALGGEAFAPTGGHVLQQALKNRGPVEIPGGWGSATPEGVTWNEAKQQEADLKHLEFMAGQQRQIEQAALERQRRKEEAEARREDRQAARQDRMTLAGIAAGARGEAAASRAEQAKWRFEDQARAHFDQITKDTRDVLNTARAVSSLPTDGKLSPVQQQSIIIMLNKFQDPGSVVREGEFNRVAEAQGLLQKWGNLPAKIATGQPLPPALVKDIQAAMKLYTSAAENTMRDTAADYVRLARQRGLDAAQIVTDARWHPKAEGPGPSQRGRGTADSPIVVQPRGGGGGPGKEETIKVPY